MKTITALIMVFIILITFTEPTILVQGTYINSNGLTIVVTFPSLVNDIKELISRNDNVISIVPAGTDPHEYQLTINDIELLKKADLIISTGHTSFEKRIRDLINTGEIKAILIEIPKIKNIVIMNNPVTGLPNLHMPIYDPLNYICFINNITYTLQMLRPERANVYNENRLSIISNITYLLASSPRIYIDAVADKPLTQYAVSWLGIRIKYLLIKEPGVPATPNDLSIIRDNMVKGSIGIVIITEPATDSASKQLIDMAIKYDIPILYVPSPMSNASIIEKLNYIASQISDPIKYYEKQYGSSGSCTVEQGGLGRYGYGIVGGMVIASIVTFIAYIIISRRREEVV